VVGISPTARLPVSLVVITLDAGPELAACLDSVGFAGEVVVVDSGSRDHTVDVAMTRGARVVHEPWRGFGPQKQFAVDQAANDWVLCLDADERLTPELAAAIQEALRAPRHDAYEFARRNYFLGRWLRHGEGYPDWNRRLFRKSRARWSDDPVHERVVCEGSIGRLRGDLLHASAESLERYLDKQNRYTSIQAELLSRRGERVSLGRLIFSPLLRFAKFYLLRGGFLDGAPGLVHTGIGAFASFSKYAKLLALNAARKSA
jgi:glycosyltransferase involved in cell wall biosynthesis